MIDTRGVWGHAPPELGFEIASEALVESSACSYLLKPVKPLETLNEAARMTISHKRAFLVDCHHLPACIISHMLALTPFHVLLLWFCEVKHNGDMGMGHLWL